MLNKKNKFKSAFIVSLVSLSMLAMPVYAEDMGSSSSEEDSLFVELLPVIVPSVTVGGMILSSRTKKKSVSAMDYITLEVTSSSEEDVGKVKTTEDASRSKYEKTSYLKTSEAVVNGKTIFSALSESVKKDNKDGGASGQ